VLPNIESFDKWDSYCLCLKVATEKGTPVEGESHDKVVEKQKRSKRSKSAMCNKNFLARDSSFSTRCVAGILDQNGFGHVRSG
jgi:hypothetical protein